MKETIKQLKGDFVVLDLGSAHTQSIVNSAPEFTEAITLIEVDPLLQQGSGKARLGNRICLNQPVAGTPGKRTFKKRKFPDCSSFLEPKEELIQAYGLEDYFVQVDAMEVECATISELLQQKGISRVDFFKTDLEGMDFEILSSAPRLVEQSLVLQCELRFQPFYEGEPYFHQVAGYLTDLGFELVSLKNSVWKYATPNRPLERDGRTVWTDAIFFLSPKYVRERFGNNPWKAFARQIILARLLSLNNVAEYLHVQEASNFPADVRRELLNFVRPRFSFPRFMAAQVNKLPYGWVALGAVRRFFRYGYMSTALFPPAHVGDI
jgi:FkbM family methyltransferase